MKRFALSVWLLAVAAIFPATVEAAPVFSIRCEDAKNAFSFDLMSTGETKREHGQNFIELSIFDNHGDFWLTKREIGSYTDGPESSIFFAMTNQKWDLDERTISPNFTLMIDRKTGGFTYQTVVKGKPGPFTFSGSCEKTEYFEPPKLEPVTPAPVPKNKF